MRRGPRVPRSIPRSASRRPCLPASPPEPSARSLPRGQRREASCGECRGRLRWPWRRSRQRRDRRRSCSETPGPDHVHPFGVLLQARGQPRWAFSPASPARASRSATIFVGAMTRIAAFLHPLDRLGGLVEHGNPAGPIARLWAFFDAPEIQQGRGPLLRISSAIRGRLGQLAGSGATGTPRRSISGSVAFGSGLRLLGASPSGAVRRAREIVHPAGKDQDRGGQGGAASRGSLIACPSG